MKRKLLVTGAAGELAGILIPELARDFDLRLTDRRRGSPDLGVERSELEDLSSLRRLCEGVDTVVHLGAEREVSAPMSRLVGGNIVGVYNIFEAARLSRCRRVIFASSIHAGLRSTEADPGVGQPGFAPDNLYGASKVFGEALASLYSSQGLSCLCLRLGWVTDNWGNDANHPLLDLVLTPGDLIRLITAAVNAPDSLRFGIYWGLSANTGCRFSIEETRKQLGYTPVDDAPRLAEAPGFLRKLFRTSR